MHIIPNKLIAALVAGFYCYAFVVAMPLDDIVEHTIVGLGALVVGFGFFLSGMSRPGTIKLIATAFLWLNFDLGIGFMLISVGLGIGYVKIRRFFDGRTVIGDTRYPYLPFAIAAVAILAVYSIVSPGDVSAMVPPQ